jgi:hypothetical protein
MSRRPEFIVLALDNELLATIVSDPALGRLGPDVVFEAMFNGEWERFLYTVAFHDGGLRGEEHLSKLPRWDQVRKRTTELLTRVTDDIFMPADYQFHHWVTHHVAALRLYHEPPRYRY